MNKTKHNNNLVKKQDNEDNKGAKLRQLISMYDICGDNKKGTSVIMKSTGKSLKVDFITPDKSMLGYVKAKNFNMAKGEIGIYDTKTLNKMLTALGDDEINIKLERKDWKDNDGKKVEKIISMLFESGDNHIKYTTADKSVIPDVPKLRKLPKFITTMTLDNEQVKEMVKYLRLVNSLSENDGYDQHSLTFDYQTDGELEVRYGDRWNNITNTIPWKGKLPVEAIQSWFNSYQLSGMLSANDNCNKVTIKLSECGSLMKGVFDYGSYFGEYLLVGSTYAHENELYEEESLADESYRKDMEVLDSELSSGYDEEVKTSSSKTIAVVLPSGDTKVVEVSSPNEEAEDENLEETDEVSA